MDGERVWEHFLTIEGEPLVKQETDEVILFAEGNKTMAVFWRKRQDRLIVVPRHQGTAMRPLNSFVNLYLSEEGSETTGFQLDLFSRASLHVWRMLGREKTERVFLSEILSFYEGMYDLTRRPANRHDANFLAEKFEELRVRFGHITILEPDYARMKPL
jgi:hypothetical protein